MSGTCSLLSPPGDPWPSRLLPSHTGVLGGRELSQRVHRAGLRLSFPRGDAPRREQVFRVAPSLLQPQLCHRLRRGQLRLVALSLRYPTYTMRIVTPHSKSSVEDLNWCFFNIQEKFTPIFIKQNLCYKAHCIFQKVPGRYFMENRWGNNGNSERFYFGGSKITANGDCSHEIKRRLLPGRKAMTNLDSTLKSRDIMLLTKVCLVKAMVFPVVMYGCESWTIKKAEHRRIDAFELCWRRLLRVSWTARRSN